MSEDPISVYAIDFGTSNSLVAGTNSKKIVDPLSVSPGSNDSTILRSIMYFSKSSSVSFGDHAIQSYVDESGEGRLIRSVKKYLPSISFTGTQVAGKVYGLEDLIGRFLRELKLRADRLNQTEVTQVLMGRPALFSHDLEKDKLAQKRLHLAAESAGFKDIDFFPEPLAAAYEYRKIISGEKIILVVDLGGGTSDFTVMKIHPTDPSQCEVLSIGGVSVAGDKLDGQIMREIVSPHFGSQVEYKMPLSSNVLSMPASLKSNLSSPADITLMSQKDVMNFLREAEKGVVNPQDKVRMQQLFHLIGENLGFSLFEKIEESKRQVCSHDFGHFIYDMDEIFVEEKFSRADFNQVIQEKANLILSTMDDVIQQAQLQHSDIDSICCTGGTSKVPLIRDELEKRFGAEKIQSFQNFHSVIKGLSERALEMQLA